MTTFDERERGGSPPAGNGGTSAANVPAGGPRANPRQAPVRGPMQPPGEVDGPKGPEPTRFGDWEKGGRCTDF